MTAFYTKPASVCKYFELECVPCLMLRFQSVLCVTLRQSGTACPVDPQVGSTAAHTPAITLPDSTPMSSTLSLALKNKNGRKRNIHPDSFLLPLSSWSSFCCCSGCGVNQVTGVRKRCVPRSSIFLVDFLVDIREPLTYSKYMNTLPLDKKLTILNAMIEGNSIRSTERMTGVHRDTIMRLTARTGEQCRDFLDMRIRNVRAERVIFHHDAYYGR